MSCNLWITCMHLSLSVMWIIEIKLFDCYRYYFINKNLNIIKLVFWFYFQKALPHDIPKSTFN